MSKEFKSGLKDGIPIALGYLSVSFSLGIMALAGGLSVFHSALMSLTNITSAGQFAGIQIIIAGGTLLEMILTQLVINLRYALMSLSLSQKLSPDMKLWQRFVVAFANTDEIFAVAMAHGKSLTFPYMIGLQLLPVLGWVAGTVLGGVAASLMPKSVSAAMGVALYGMFIAIIIPPAKKNLVIAIAVAVSFVCSYVCGILPYVRDLSSGTRTIVLTVVISSIVALIKPVEDEQQSQESSQEGK